MTTGNILELSGVTLAFDGFTVLDHLDFTIGYGELRFLIGPNGAGKTTMVDVITGRTRPDAGRVIFDGRIDVTRYSEHELVRLGIARKFQTPAVFASLSVFDNVEVAAGFRQGIWARFGPGSGEERDRVCEALDRVGLLDRAARPAGGLSHGGKQWLEIAMLLAQSPKLLLLDEPVAGLTKRERERTGEILDMIAQTSATLVIEHDMEFVRQFARTVTVLDFGKVLSQGSVEEVQNDERVVEVYLGRGRARRHPVAT